MILVTLKEWVLYQDGRKGLFIVNKTAEGRVNDGATKSVSTTRKILHIYVNPHEQRELIIN